MVVYLLQIYESATKESLNHSWVALPERNSSPEEHRCCLERFAPPEVSVLIRADGGNAGAVTEDGWPAAGDATTVAELAGLRPGTQNTAWTTAGWTTAGTGSWIWTISWTSCRQTRLKHCRRNVKLGPLDPDRFLSLAAFWVENNFSGPGNVKKFRIRSEFSEPCWFGSQHCSYGCTENEGRQKNKITENDERRRKDVFKEIGRQKCCGKHITGNIYLLTVLWIRNWLLFGICVQFP